jgi:pyruvate dehydrogenase E2 component (dihydrolipoamide acetyltransferase)
VPAAPSVRALARDLGVNIQDVKGTGVGGRISAEDVKKHTKEIVKKGGGAPSPKLPDFSQWGEIRREAMTKVRKLTAENLVASWSSTPQVTHFDQADVTQIEEFRQKYSKEVEAQNGKLTVTSILLQVVARALHIFPRFNASVDMRNREIIVKSYINIGVAVDTERGLLVPVVKNADQKNLTELSVEVTDLAERTRNKKVKPDELEGGNFTISNLGGIGGTHFTPVIYAPQVAILGISRSSWQPTVTENGIESRMILPLTLTYDHRIIDGADGARFLKWIVQVLEHPFRSFLGQSS